MTTQWCDAHEWLAAMDGQKADAARVVCGRCGIRREISLIAMGTRCTPHRVLATAGWHAMQPRPEWMNGR